jgi:hypothetical protein
MRPFDFRRLVQIESDEEWEKLPKTVRAPPVYFRKTANGIELWPTWPDYVTNPNVMVAP